MNEHIKFIAIDLFCGAGGASEAMIQSGAAVVIACINHDATAIASHKLNHPESEYFVEDIEHFNIEKLLPIIEDARIKYPNAKLVLWASAECTNFSNAKGGLPRDADSRSLPLHLVDYIRLLKPDLCLFENVREFLAWGPMRDGKPISRQNGIYYQRWVKSIEEMGYYYAYRILDSADFGAYQSRKRWYAVFAMDKKFVVFPTQTHAKKPSKPSTLFDKLATLQPHKAVRDVLNLKDTGKSIFNRQKPDKVLGDKTLERILAGLQKFVCGDAFIMRNNTPGYCSSLDKAAPTVTCKDTSYLITQFIFNPQFSNSGNDIDKPCPTVIASQHKRPLQLATIEMSATAHERLEVTESDSEMAATVKQYCLDNNIADVYLRQLNTKELAQIQGFPKSYKFANSATRNKYHIGNAVEVNQVRAWIEVLANAA